MDQTDLLEGVSFSTEVAPYGQFEVDKKEYNLRHPDSLNKDEEARYLYLSQRLARLGEKADRVNTEREVTAVWNDIFDARVQVLTLFTDMSTETATELGMTQVYKLFSVIRKLTQPEPDPKPEEDGGGS